MFTTVLCMSDDEIIKLQDDIKKLQDRIVELEQENTDLKQFKESLLAAYSQTITLFDDAIFNLERIRFERKLTSLFKPEQQ